MKLSKKFKTRFIWVMTEYPESKYIYPLGLVALVMAYMYHPLAPVLLIGLAVCTLYLTVKLLNYIYQD